ncbi:MAG: formylglycine-generating enzyme family protein [Thermodesulfobacteriota bacterium]
MVLLLATGLLVGLFACAGREPAPDPTSINKLKMEFVYIPPGSFVMGSPEKEPGRFDDEILHKVVLTKGFYIQTTEVTQGQWEAVMHDNPSGFKSCGYNCPVENVSWHDVQEFIRRLNKLEGTERYRLPTEAEWEYVLRLGTEKSILKDVINIATSVLFPSGECLSTNEANYNGNFPLTDCEKGDFRNTTLPVASLAANRMGVYDLHGNVYEWCQDLYGPYPNYKVEDPVGTPARKSDSYRVYRGGSWYSSARYCRAAYRGKEEPDYKYHNLGFRLVKNP